MIQEKKTVQSLSRYQLSFLYGYYLSSVSPNSNNKLGFESATDLISQFVPGVCYHDVTRAVRAFSSSFELDFDQFVNVLLFFLENKLELDLNAVTSFHKVISEDPLFIKTYLTKLCNEIPASNSSIFQDLDLLHSSNLQLHEIIKTVIIDHPVLKIPEDSFSNQCNNVQLNFEFNIQDVFNPKPTFLDKLTSFQIGYFTSVSLANQTHYSRICYSKNEEYHIGHNFNLTFNINESNCNLSKAFTIINSLSFEIALYAAVILENGELCRIRLGKGNVPLVPILFASPRQCRLGLNFIPDDIFCKETLAVTFIVSAESDPIVRKSLNQEEFRLIYESPEAIQKDLGEAIIKKKVRFSEKESQMDQITDKTSVNLFDFYQMGVDKACETKRSREFQIIASDELGHYHFLNQFAKSYMSIHNPGMNEVEINKFLSVASKKPGLDTNIIRSIDTLNFSGAKLTQLERALILFAYLKQNPNQHHKNLYVFCGDWNFHTFYGLVEFIESDCFFRPQQSRHTFSLPGHLFSSNLVAYNDFQTNGTFPNATNISENSEKIEHIHDQEGTKKKKKSEFIGNDERFLDTGKYKLRFYRVDGCIDDALPTGIEIGSLFNEENIWVNIQKQSKLSQTNWNLFEKNSESWKAIFPSQYTLSPVYSRSCLLEKSPSMPAEFCEEFNRLFSKFVAKKEINNYYNEINPTDYFLDLHRELEGFLNQYEKLVAKGETFLEVKDQSINLLLVLKHHLEERISEILQNKPFLLRITEHYCETGKELFHELENEFELGLVEKNDIVCIAFSGKVYPFKNIIQHVAIIISKRPN